MAGHRCQGLRAGIGCCGHCHHVAGCLCRRWCDGVGSIKCYEDIEIRKRGVKWHPFFLTISFLEDDFAADGFAVFQDGAHDINALARRGDAFT